jgi:prepilin-type N-terminal cleavage/methylation domain-containing protein
MDNKGLTMIEVLMVFAIVAIVAAMGFPTFMDQRDKARIKRAGRDMVSHFQMARINAMRDGGTWAVAFDTAQDKYSLVHAGNDRTLDTGDDVTAKEIELSTYGKVSFGIGDGMGGRPGGVAPDDGVSFSGNRVLFQSDGTSVSGTVYVKNAKGQTFAVGSIARTGRVKVWANYGQGWGS